MAPATRYARARDGVSIAYQVVGDGPLDLVWVPQSFGAFEALWEHPTVVRFFDQLGTLGRLILFDRRGSGLSDRRGGPPPLEEQVDDVRAVMDAAGSEQAVVLALMEGGPMAMLFAAASPLRVRALVLYATYARATSAPGYEFAWSAQERAAAMEKFHAEWGTGAATSYFAPSHADDVPLREWLGRYQRLGMAPGDARAISEVLAQVDVRHVLASIRVPTLVLHRTHDSAMSVEHSRYLARNIPGARLVELPGVDTLPFLGDTAGVLGEIEEFLTGSRQAHDTDRVLATVMFTDIVGSTETAATLGDRPWRELLSEHDRRVRACLARYHGREIKSVGDGFLAVFDGPARAVRAGRAIADEVGALGLQVRAGLHTGEIEAIDGDVGGLAVHIGARVMGEAQPGEVLVSGTVKDLVVGSGLRFAERGVRALRGVPGEWPLWAVVA
jgi:class 3 adenylate cyclase/pimeloyl-ACP methyl ester carboxylesterase